MKLSEIKKLNEGQTVLVDMGYKFNSSKYYAKFKNTEVVPSHKGMEELCVVVPFEVVDDKCGFATYCLKHNMLIEPEQILKTFKK